MYFRKLREWTKSDRVHWFWRGDVRMDKGDAQLNKRFRKGEYDDVFLQKCVECCKCWGNKFFEHSQILYIQCQSRWNSGVVTWLVILDLQDSTTLQVWLWGDYTSGTLEFSLDFLIHIFVVVTVLTVTTCLPVLPDRSIDWSRNQFQGWILKVLTWERESLRINMSICSQLCLLCRGKGQTHFVQIDRFRVGRHWGHLDLSSNIIYIYIYLHTHII